MKTKYVILSLAIVFILTVAVSGLAELNDQNKSEPQPDGQTLPILVNPRTGEVIDWEVIAAGGTRATSTNFTHVGTAGQNTIGRSKSSSFCLNSGFQLAPASHGLSCCLVPGDVNEDGQCNVADAVFLVNFTFYHGPPPNCMTTADVNNDCAVNVGDAKFLVAYGLLSAGWQYPKCSSCL